MLAGSALLLFFINLIGTNNSGVIGEFYWSEVDSSSLDSSRDKTRWTLYSICDVKDGKNSGCTSRSPAFPYSPSDNFDSSDNLPDTFIKNRDLYYYLSRFAYAFFLIGIAFSIIALIPVILSCCLTGFITGILSSVAVGTALLFTAAGAAFNTAIHVKGRNAFNDAGIPSHLDTKTFGILWAAVACLLLAFIWMCVVSGKGATKKYNKHYAESESYTERKVNSTDSSHQDHLMYDEPGYNNGTYTGTQQPQQKRFFFSRKQQQEPTYN